MNSFADQFRLLVDGATAIEKPVSEAQASELPLSLRLAAYAVEKDMDRATALVDLVEAGLLWIAAERLLKNEPMPIYLYKSYLDLAARARA